MEDKDMISLASHEAKMRPVETALKTAEEATKGLGLKLEAAQTANVKLDEAKRKAEGRVLELEAETVALKAGVDKDGIRIKHLETANEHLEAKVSETKAEALKATNAKLADDINAVIADATAKSVAPAIFDGSQADPVAWMSARYVNFDAFKQQVAILSGVPATALSSAPVKSGHDSAEAAKDSKDEPSAASKAADALLKRAGVNVVANFDGVTTPEEAQARFEAAQAEKNKE